MVLGRFGWFWVVPCFSNYRALIKLLDRSQFQKYQDCMVCKFVLVRCLLMVMVEYNYLFP